MGSVTDSFANLSEFLATPGAALSGLTEFLNGPEGREIDAVLSVGQHFVVRNAHGWYGDPARIPFVSERGAGPSLKAFAFLLLKLSSSFLSRPFELTDYQAL